MNLIKILITFSLLALVKPEFGLKCFFYFESTFAIYNIKNLYLDDNKSQELDYTLKNADGSKVKGKLFINLCGSLNIPEDCLSSVNNSSILFVSDDSKICVNLLTKSREKTTYKLINENEPLNGFKIHQENSAIDIFIQCEKEKKDPNPEYVINDKNNLGIKSSDACGISNEAARFVFTNKYLCCVVFFVIGIIFLFVGGYKWNLIFSFTGFLLGFGTIFFILWAFVKYEQSTKSYLIITAIAIIVGVIMACLCHTFSILSYLFLGFLVGFLITKYVLLTIQFAGKDYQILLLEIGTGLVLAILCGFVKKYMIAVLTSILGGFLVCYSFGFCIGLLDNFFDILEKIRSGSDIGVANYVFFGFFILISLIGMFLQFKFIRSDNKPNVGYEIVKEKLIIE